MKITAEQGSSAIVPSCFQAGGVFASMAPSMGSILALSGADDAAAWLEVRKDPALLLALVRHSQLQPDLIVQDEFQKSLPALLDVASDLLGNRISSEHSKNPFPGKEKCLGIAGAVCELARISGAVDPEIAWVAGMLGDLDLLFLTEGKAQEFAWKFGLPVWLRILNGLNRDHGVSVALDAGVSADLVHLLLIAKNQGGRFPFTHRAGQSWVKKIPTGPELDLLLNSCPQSANGVESPVQKETLPILQGLLTQGKWIRSQQMEIRLLREECSAYMGGLKQRIGSEDERLLEKKLDSLGELAAGAGHEINNPLAVIQGNAQFLMGKLDDLELEESGVDYRAPLLCIIRQARRIHEILKGLMQFARPFPPNRSRLALKDVIAPVLEKMTGWAGDCKVQLTLDGGYPDNATLFVDGEQSRTALECIVRNGIEAAGQFGWVKIQLIGTADFMEVAVTDSGKGLSPESLEHLFDPFYSGRMAGRGKGLGLSIAWKLAHANHGRVEFMQAGGNLPTRFSLILPTRDFSVVQPNPENATLAA